MGRSYIINTLAGLLVSKKKERPGTERSSFLPDPSSFGVKADQCVEVMVCTEYTDDVLLRLSDAPFLLTTTQYILLYYSTNRAADGP